MNPRDTSPNQLKNYMDDMDRMTNEGLAAGWEGELNRNGLINTAEIEEESPPTLNGKPV